MAKPEIRLKGFKGEWEEKTFSQIVNVNSGMDYKGLNAGNIPVYGTGGYMLSVDKSLSNEDAIGIGRKGTIDSPQLLKAPFWTIDTLFFMTLKKGYDLNFIYSLCQTVRWKDYDESTGVPSLSKNNIDRIESFVPNISEQKCIANYFKSLDSMIQGVTKKIASLKQMKQACLVSMFPQAGETKPRVRFKGFKGEWENVSFKDITYLSGTKNRDNLPLESYSISNEKGFVPQNEQFEQGGTMANADKRLYYIVTPDSFAYNPARINVGSIGYDDLDKDVIVSSLYVVFKTDDNTNNYFLNHWFKTPMFRKMIELYQEGGVRLYFFYDKLCQCHFRRPCLAEQEKIASFFTNLDKQISLQEARLEKLKQIKSACLDKMFV